MRTLVLILLAALVVEAQTPDPYSRARALMEAAAEKQRSAIQAAHEAATEKPREAIAASMEASVARQITSVRKQAQVAETAAPALFVLPWPEPAALAIGLESALQPQCQALPDIEINSLVQRAADREGLKSDVLRAIIRRESAFHPCAVSVKGARGLMQLMPATIEQFGVRDPFNPQESIDAGARFFKHLLSRYEGNLSLALAAYNAGPGRVDADRVVPNIPETIGYVSGILEALEGKR